ncbi:MAG TPA: hypothetical protein VH475_05100 [Tepidisphaeraceae bacterium]|jgi:hypothetical protein
MFRRLAIFTLLVAAMTLASSVIAKGKRDKPRNREGVYSLKVAGYVTGDGDANVEGNSLTLTLTVAPSAGGSQQTETVALRLGGASFSSNQPFLGQTANFQGRLDAPDDEKERELRGVRLVGRIRSADGQYATIVGYIPSLANTKDLIDMGQDTNATPTNGKTDSGGESQGHDDNGKGDRGKPKPKHH